MESSGQLRKSGIRTTVVLYGLAMAVLVFILKYVEYRYWIRDLRMEVYVGVVAVLFTGLGVWVGSKLLAEKKEKQVVAVPLPVLKDGSLRSLGISARELEVLHLMAQGCSNREIADRLFISLPTVKSHASSLFVKLDVSRRTQAVHKAKSLGIIA
ncbi:MAG: DNA-binding response regulator [Flavobacteriales bacterium]|nr:DNA-binding response regulator [Flavobacteriales bacterium]